MVAAMGTYYFVSGHIPGAEETFYYVLFISGALVLITNFCSNIYLLERYYPDTRIEKNFLVLIAVMMSLSSLIITFLTLSYFYIFYDAFLSEEALSYPNNYSRIIVLLFGAALVISYFILWMQVALKKSIQRNFSSVFHNFLESAD
jgi:hypothetical protein